MNETEAEEYYLKLDEFLIYIEDVVNPARIEASLKPIELSEAKACARIIWDFSKEWNKDE